MLIIRLISGFFIMILLSSCKDNINNVDDVKPFDSSLKITFVELGSTSCYYCKKMVPVMDSIQKKYGSQIFVKFIDVIKNYKESVPYKIRVMPTQVFLDSNNIEIHRHEGFYAEDSIHIFLQSKGLKILDK